MEFVMTLLRIVLPAAAAAVLVFTAPVPLPASGQNANGLFEMPLLITSAGQSPDVQLAVILAKRAGIDHSLSKVAAAGDLAAGAKSLAIVVGASLKGLGAAGIDTAKEKDRVKGLLAEAEKRNIPVLVMHLGGEQRRGQLTDEMIAEVLPSAAWALVLKSGNHDGLFTRICEEHGISLVEIDKTAEGAEPLKSVFKPKD